MTDQQVKDYMVAQVTLSNRFWSCGAVMCTELAEEAAVHFDIQVADEELFDHFCEIALEVAQEVEGNQV